MDREFVEVLLDELAKHPSLSRNIDKTLLKPRLRSTDVTLSTKFYEVVNGARQTFMLEGDLNDLSINRVLRNQNAAGYNPGAFKRGIIAFVNKVSSYSSNNLARDLRMDPTMVEQLTRSSVPFSLLGKLRITYADSGENYGITRPILIVPGANRAVLDAWEKRNTMLGVERKYEPAS